MIGIKILELIYLGVAIATGGPSDSGCFVGETLNLMVNEAYGICAENLIQQGDDYGSGCSY